MVSRASGRIYDAVVGYFGAEGSFTQFICPKSSMDRTTLAEIGNELSIQYVVPPSVCQTTAAGTHQLAVSAVLALLDEYSTYALMIQDRNHRPGVSVTLDIELFKPVCVGENVRLVSRCDKIGLSIAFISMEIISAKGELVARGKHIKYVKMGLVWDILTSFLLFPLVLAFLEYIVSSRKTTSAAPGPDATIPEVGRIFSVLNLEPVTDTSSLFAADLDADAGKGKKKSKRKEVPTFADGEVCYAMRVNRSLSNVLGAMHGGAIAAAAEEASQRHRRQLQQRLGATQGSDGFGGFVDRINVTYKSPAKVSASLICNCQDLLLITGHTLLPTFTTGRAGDCCRGGQAIAAPRRKGHSRPHAQQKNWPGVC